MVEQRDRRDNPDGSSKWEISLGNVAGLFEEWPVPKNQAFEALQERTDIAISWYMRLSATLVDQEVIKEIREPKIGTKIPKKLDAKGLLRVALMAQALKDQGLLFIESPQRTHAIKEIIEVMRVEPNLCLE